MDGFVGGPVRLPVATAQGHLLRQLQGRWPGRHGCGAQEAIVRQLQLVVGEQHALRQGHLRLRRVLPPVRQGGRQVTAVVCGGPLLNNSHRRRRQRRAISHCVGGAVGMCMYICPRVHVI